MSPPCRDISVPAPAESVSHTFTTSRLVSSPVLYTLHICRLCDANISRCLIYARAQLEYVIIIMWLRSVIKVLRLATGHEIRGR